MRDWRELIKKGGLKVTPQRIMVLQALEASGEESHPAAEQLWDTVSQVHPDVTRATVYRILKSFTEQGIVRELNFRDGRSRYEINNDHHHHFVCLGCHATEKIGACAFNICALQNDGRKVVSHSLEVFGYCANCNAG